MADIPGLIEGAGDGVGLGHEFLRHVDRCRLLVHIVDAAGSEGRDPVEDLLTINGELSGYSEALATRPQIIAANKCDILDPESDNLKRLYAKAEELGYEVVEISAATQQGVKELVYKVWQMLESLPPVVVYEPEVDLSVATELPKEREIIIEHIGDVWYITGAWVEKVVSSINFDDYESRMYFDRVLRKAGVFDMLERDGVQERDTVDVLGIQFEYVY
jgi:GTP-binding protein